MVLTGMFSQNSLAFHILFLNFLLRIQIIGIFLLWET
jgi:hypothetical protein